jgi:glycosyltransferase involved in cell wall biosynthesis
MGNYINIDNAPLVTVIIPTCNRFEMLLCAIESVRLQTFKSIEIIVCDNSMVPIDRRVFKSSDINYHYIAPMIGASKARNYGANLAKGEFLAFLDDDDIWDENFLEYMIKKMRKNDLDCVYGCKHIMVNNDISPYKTIQKDDLKLDVLLYANPGVGGINLLVRKDIFLSVKGFDSSLPRGNDRAFAIDLIMHGANMDVEPKAVAIMRQHDGIRLRNNHLKMLLWVNKYKRNMSVYFVIFSVVRILAASAFSEIKKLLHCNKSM